MESLSREFAPEMETFAVLFVLTLTFGILSPACRLGVTETETDAEDDCVLGVN